MSFVEIVPNFLATIFSKLIWFVYVFMSRVHNNFTTKIDFYILFYTHQRDGLENLVVVFY